MLICKRFMGVDGCWCALWSSKPVRGVSSFLGGFDSHILPPKLAAYCLVDAALPRGTIWCAIEKYVLVIGHILYYTGKLGEKNGYDRQERIHFPYR